MATLYALEKVATVFHALDSCRFIVFQTYTTIVSQLCISYYIYQCSTILFFYFSSTCYNRREIILNIYKCNTGVLSLQQLPIITFFNIGKDEFICT